VLKILGSDVTVAVPAWAWVPGLKHWHPAILLHRLILLVSLLLKMKRKSRLRRTRE